jgi:Protein of unknown function (DUF4038)/Domain of unknown function (DUF5060)
VNKGNRFSGSDQFCSGPALGCAIVICFIFMTGTFTGIASAASSSVVHVWEKKELTFTSSSSWDNPYVEVSVWVDLVGPGFRKRVIGFWDGGRTFRVRLVAPTVGEWTWQAGSNPPDPGLSGLRGSFTAIDWSEDEKQENTMRRGFLRTTENHHAIEQADGTPFFIVGDTWYAAGTNRFRWYDDDKERPLGPEAGFKDYLRYRKAEGYNAILIIAAFPAWATDGYPVDLFINNPERTCVRSAWTEYGTKSAKNMENEGGRPFLFPGRVPGYETVFPDLDRINPAYFRYLDRKIDYLNQKGFVPIIEVARRDTGQVWKKYYSWPDSYARYVEYVWSRYQANNTVFSPVHFDIDEDTIPAHDYNAAVQLVMTRFGPPPFGQLLTANSNPSTLVNFGENSWVTLHQMGNEREHDWYWYLTEIFHSASPKPALNGEPYYAGYKDVFGLGNGGYQYGAEGGSDKDNQYVRSSMYGSFLSGGLAGHVYGAEGIWGADIESASPVKMWDAFQWQSGGEMQHLRKFAFSIGRRFQELVPDANLVSPNKTHVTLGYEGWAFAARTPDKKSFLVYFEKGCPRSQVRAALPLSLYRAQWFDPRTGSWRDTAGGELKSSSTGIIQLPDLPDNSDWGLRLEYAGTSDGSHSVH